MDDQVKKYFEKQEKNKKEICFRLREIILKQLPKTKEELKWGAVVYNEGEIYIAAVKLGVNLGIAIANLPKETRKMLKGNGKLMRHLKFLTVDDINEKTVLKILSSLQNDLIHEI